MYNICKSMYVHSIPIMYCILDILFIRCIYIISLYLLGKVLLYIYIHVGY